MAVNDGFYNYSDSTKTTLTGLFNPGLGGDLLEIPSSVTTIEANAFKDTLITGTLILPGNVKIIGESAFHGCNGLTGPLLIPASVEVIGQSAFHQCTGLTGTLLIVDNVLNIGKGAFFGCNRLTSLIFGNNSKLTIIDQAVFSGCNGLIGTLTIPQGITRIVDTAFSGCYGLTTLVLNENLQSINKLAFSGCTALMGTLTIPSSVQDIGELAFSNCNTLTTLVLNEGLKVINNSSFFQCTGLTGDLLIPLSVTSVGNTAFIGCSKIDVAYYATTVIGNDAFVSAKSLKIITVLVTDSNNQITGVKPDKVIGTTFPFPYIPSNVTSIAENAFRNRDDLTGELRIPSNITTIGFGAFQGCNQLTNLIFEDNSKLTTIDTNTFSGCYGFTGTLTIPSSVTNIGNSAFSECYGFTGSLTIPVTVTNIGEFAFSGCIGLRSSSYYITTAASSNSFKDCKNVNVIYSWFNITNNVITGINPEKSSKPGATVPFPEIPFNVIEIKESAFKDRSDLTGAVIIPPNVEYVEELAFSGCDGLTSITYYALTTVNANSFPVSKTPIVLPWFFINNGEIVGFKPDKVTGVTLPFPQIPLDVTGIGENAFKDRNDLTGTLTIPLSVTSIGNSAFSGCTGLTKISYYATTTLNELTKGSVFLNTVIPTIIPSFIINNGEIVGFKPDKVTGVKLTLPQIPSDVTLIGENAFKDRNDLTGTLTIPLSVTGIGNSAFSGCIGLTKITYYATTTTFTDAFKDCKPRTVIPWFNITNDRIIGFKPDLSGKVKLKLPQIPSNVTSIGEYAFQGRTDLTGTLVIPPTVLDIRDSSFKGCKGLSKISYYITTSILPTSFAECKKPRVLPWFNITNNRIVGFIPEKLGKVKLALPKIPSNVTSIAENAFKDRSDLTGILAIPQNVNTIGANAFSGCTGFSKISYYAGTTVDLTSFTGCKPQTILPILIINNKEIVGLNPVKGTIKLLLPTIPSSVTSIKADAFRGRTDLTGTLAIPSNIKTIGSNAFNGCTGFSKISYYVGTTVELDAFKGCKKQTIIVPKKMIIVDKFKIGFYRGKLII